LEYNKDEDKDTEDEDYKDEDYEESPKKKVKKTISLIESFFHFSMLSDFRFIKTIFFIFTNISYLYFS